ncbi:hypothetical protein [Pedobacter heparinus]|uniref:hypothetical protein n=1 Tax=Pedobacter heparinus TaxID=984 RepID=UPI00292E8368|nr:hypothetical protein [Pedobacter heparinus]
MKNLISSTFKPLTFLLFSAVLLASCGKDKDKATPTTGSIDIAVGTFKGKISVFDRPTSPSNAEYFDAIVTVAKVGDNQLQITPKSGEAYSDATPRTYTITEKFEGTIGSTSTTGSFIYKNSDKSMAASGVKVSANERGFVFEGVKQ